ncbi:hypothetical protein BKA65DRAFT_133391 [Rhexocercosporidium sp. MPI-PUGE-AT-0058]|nr:hypothetical protein BKA65DRAFT_133391 [Rhexocercosporidium sp. MPI-PUGE-AT-0058]
MVWYARLSQSSLELTVQVGAADGLGLRSVSLRSSLLPSPSLPLLPRLVWAREESSFTWPSKGKKKKGACFPSLCLDRPPRWALGGLYEFHSHNSIFRRSTGDLAREGFLGRRQVERDLCDLSIIPTQHGPMTPEWRRQLLNIVVLWREVSIGQTGKYDVFRKDAGLFFKSLGRGLVASSLPQLSPTSTKRGAMQSPHEIKGSIVVDKKVKYGPCTVPERLVVEKLFI